MKKFFTVENLYRFLLACFVISLCIFHGKVLGMDFIRGNQSDFLTKQLFPADIILAALIILTLIYKRAARLDRILIILAILTTWSILPRGSNYNFYAIIRLIECFVCFYVFYHVKNRAIIYKTASILGVIESIIGFVQFHLKHSVGLHVLGEPIMNVFTDGIAKINLADGSKVIRAYGTFSHPNSLGAFLVISLAFTTYLIFKENRKIYYFNLLIILIGITVTFSRAAILVAAVFVIGTITSVIYKKFVPKHVAYLYVFVIALGVLISFVSYGTYLGTRATIEDGSTTLRLQYDLEGLRIGEHYKLFGVGYGNVIYAMDKIIPASQPDWAIQPPHNYLIIVSGETGLIGLVLFLAFLIYILWLCLKKKPRGTGDGLEKTILFWLFINILLLIQLDHYFYDIPLMALMFWMVLGMISGAVKNNSISAAEDNIL